MKIGSLGDIVFSVSDKATRTFSGLSWDSSANYTAHKRHLKPPLLEYTGVNADTISFTMYLSAFCGVKPAEELEKLSAAERDGKILRLIIGKKTIGKYRWVIVKLSRKLNTIDKKGNILAASVTVTLNSYEKK